MSGVLSGAEGPLSLLISRRPTDALDELSGDLRASLRDVAKLTQALLDLGPITSQSPRLSAAANEMRRQISAVLLEASESASPDLGAQMSLRAEAIVTGDYEAAARHMVTVTSPWRLVLSEPTWTWTGAAAPTLILFREEAGWEISTGLERVLEELAASDQVAAEGWATRPGIAVGSKRLTAGRASIYPQEFANFFPEDESVVGNELTLFYADFFLDRIRQVSLPNLETLHPGLGDGLTVDASWHQWAIDWFRGHDLSHFVYDDVVFDVVGLSRFYTNGLREFFADTGGLLAARPGMPPASGRLYLAELLRYASRDDGHRSADALSSRVQLAALLAPFGSWDEVSKAIDTPDFIAPLLELREALLRTVKRGNAARVEAEVDRALGTSSIADPFVNAPNVRVDDLFLSDSADGPRNRSADGLVARCGHTARIVTSR